MQVVALNQREALARLATEFGLQLTNNGISHELIAHVMRSQFARMFPCSQSALLEATRHALGDLTNDAERLGKQAEDVLEDLQTCGDVVELAQITVAEEHDQAHWLFPAPPSFVMRGSRCYLFGIAPDDVPFLPGDVWQRVRSNGAARYIELAQPDTLSPALLVALGLRQIEDHEWIQPERNETAAQHLERLSERLRQDGVKGNMPGMRVLLHQTSSRAAYPQRWTAECNASGLHIARLEQPYGAPLWYLVELNAGRSVRSLVLPYRSDRARACDQAWRAQMAIDATQGLPARFTVQAKGEEALLKFDFPIPLAARRRLLFLGGARPRGDHPYQFLIPMADIQSERRYMQECLWLQESLG